MLDKFFHICYNKCTKVEGAQHIRTYTPLNHKNITLQGERKRKWKARNKKRKKPN